MLKGPIMVTGGSGLVGTHLVARLRSLGLNPVSVDSRHDLREARAADALMQSVAPRVLFHLAARAGGICASASQKPDLYRDNVLIDTHVVDAAVRNDVQYIFAMGTACAYPERLAGAELHERDFLEGAPEATNDAYAYAKRGMLIHLEAFREQRDLEYCYCLPTNLYGPHDNFHPKHAHVVPALIRRFVEAREERLPQVRVWGDGSAQRDFLYVEDCVDAMLALARERFSGPVNVATGRQTTIRELAEVIGRSTGYAGEIEYDASMPVGPAGRVLDLSRVGGTGWEPAHALEEGIGRTVEWFEANRADIRER